MSSRLTPDQLAHCLSIRDLTNPSEGPHALQLVVDRLLAGLDASWGLPCRIHRGERIVPVADNYDNLLIGPDSVSRDARYTRYVDDTRMLRSHSSAIVVPALRQLSSHPAPDQLVACPGMVYRRDSIDWQHTGTPHQLDIWRITQQPMQLTDLHTMVETLLHSILPSCRWRLQPASHPYTRHGQQVDILSHRRWIEVAECGLAHPAVLAAAGLPGYSGLALGTGLDRLLMLVKAIPDIRLLREQDPKVAHQMLDLSPYHPISTLPACRRDLSVMVDDSHDQETIGDRIRELLGPTADLVSSVELLSQTPYHELHPNAIARMGALPGQLNLLIRVDLQSLTHTLTNQAANTIRNRIYIGLHQGTIREL